jgi:hypothetical protein
MVGVRMAAGPLEVCRLIAGIVAAIRVRSLLVGEQDLKAEDSGGRRPERLTGVEPAGRCSSSGMNAHGSVLGQVHWSPHYRIGRHAA